MRSDSPPTSGGTASVITVARPGSAATAHSPECAGGTSSRSSRAQPEDRHLRMVMATVPELRDDADPRPQLRPRSCTVFRSGRRPCVGSMSPAAGRAAEVRTAALWSSTAPSLLVTTSLRCTASASRRSPGRSPTSGRTLPLDQSVAAGDRAVADGLDRVALDAVIAGQRGWPSGSSSSTAGGPCRRTCREPWGICEPSALLGIRTAPTEAAVRCTSRRRRDRPLRLLLGGGEDAGEFDGKVKYGRLLKVGETAGDVVYREKLREDALRDLGWQMVRWTWSDLCERTRRARRPAATRLRSRPPVRYLTTLCRRRGLAMARQHLRGRGNLRAVARAEQVSPERSKGCASRAHARRSGQPGGEGDGSVAADPGVGAGEERGDGAAGSAPRVIR